MQAAVAADCHGRIQAALELDLEILVTHEVLHRHARQLTRRADASLGVR